MLGKHLYCNTCIVKPFLKALNYHRSFMHQCSCLCSLLAHALFLPKIIVFNHSMTYEVEVMKNGHESSKYLRYSQLWSRDYEFQYFQPSSHIHKEQPGIKENRWMYFRNTVCHYWLSTEDKIIPTDKFNNDVYQLGNNIRGCIKTVFSVIVVM